jgi:hypothetical protein
MAWRLQEENSMTMLVLWEVALEKANAGAGMKP